MFRFAYKLLDLLASACALLSPIAIVHWLIGLGMGPHGADWFPFLSHFFAPLNATMDHIFHPKPLDFEGQTVSISQCIVAIVFTGLFFIFQTASKMLKVVDKQIQVAQARVTEQVRRKKVAVVEQKKKVIASFSLLIVKVQYPFETHPELANLFQAHTTFGGTALEQTPDLLVLEFSRPTDALEYCLTSVRGLLRQYAQLRPVDTKPPFSVVIHAVQPQEDLQQGLDKCDLIRPYGGQNQIMLSAEMVAVIKAQGLSGQYKCNSLGLYHSQNHQELEVFTLQTDVSR